MATNKVNIIKCTYYIINNIANVLLDCVTYPAVIKKYRNTLIKK